MDVDILVLGGLFVVIKMIIGSKLGDINSIDTFNNFLRIMEMENGTLENIAQH